MRKAQEKLDALKLYSGYQITQGIEEDDEEQLECMGGSGGVQVPNETSEEEDETVPLQAGSKRSHFVSENCIHNAELFFCLLPVVWSVMEIIILICCFHWFY